MAVGVSSVLRLPRTLSVAAHTPEPIQSSLSGYIYIQMSYLVEIQRQSTLLPYSCGRVF